MADANTILLKMLVDTKEAIDNMANFRTSQKQVSDQVQNSTIIYVQNTAAVNNLEKGLQTTDKTTKGLTKTVEEATKKQINWNEVIKTTSSVLSDVAQVGMTFIANFTKLGLVGNIVKGLSAEIFGATAGLGLFGIAITSVTTLINNVMLNSAKEFQTNMANVNSILLQSPEALQAMSNEVLQLANTLKLASPADMAAALYDIGSSGFNGADGIKILTVATQAGAAGLTDTKTAGLALTKVLNGLELSADKAGESANTLFTLVNRGVLTFKDVAVNIGEVTAPSKQLGIDLTTLSAAMAIQTRKGTEASQAFTNYKSLLLALSAPSETAIAKQKELGLSFDANTIKAKGFDKVVGELLAAAEKSGDTTNFLMQMLGRQEALNAALQIGTNNGKEFREEIQKFNDAGDSFGAALAEQTKTLDAEIKKLTIGIDLMKITFGQAIGNILSKILPFFTSLIGGFNSLGEDTKRTIANIAIFAASIVPAVTALGIFAGGIVVLLGNMVALRLAFITLSTGSLPSLGAAIGAVTGSLKTLQLMFMGGAALAGAAAIFWGIDEAVKANEDSTTVWGQVLHDTLDTINLIGKARELIKGWGAQEQADKDEKDHQEEIKKALDISSKLRFKEKRTLEENIELQKALVVLSLAAHKENQKAIKEEALALNAIIDQQQKALKNKPKKLTEDQLKDRKAFLKELNEAELKEDQNKLKLAKMRADEWRDEELKKLKSNITTGIVLKSEEAKLKAQIERGYHAQINKATDEFNRERDQKRKADNDKIRSASKEKLETEINDLQTKYKKIETKEGLFDAQRTAQLKSTLQQQANLYAEYADKTKHKEFSSKEKSEFSEKSTDAQNKATNLEREFLSKSAKQKQEYYQELGKADAKYEAIKEAKLKEQGRKALAYENELEAQILADETVSSEDKLAILQQRLDNEITKYGEYSTEVLKTQGQMHVLDLKLTKDKLDKEWELNKRAGEEELSLWEQDQKIKKEQGKQAVDYEKELENQIVNDKSTSLEFILDLRKQDLANAKENSNAKLKLEKEVADLEEAILNKNFDFVRQMSTTLGNSTNETLSGIGKIAEGATNSLSTISGIIEKIQKTDSVDMGSLVLTLLAEFVRMTDTLTDAWKNFNKTAADGGGLKSIQKGIDGMMRSIPFLGGMIADFGKMLSVAFGWEKSDEEIQKINEFVGKLSESSSRALEQSNALSQAITDNITDEMEQKQAQLELDIRLVNQSTDIEAVKIEKIKALRTKFQQWEKEYNKKKADDNAKIVEENQKKISSYNEKAYNEELKLIDSTLGKKRKSLETDYQKQLDIIDGFLKKKQDLIDSRNEDTKLKKKIDDDLKKDVSRISGTLKQGFFDDNNYQHDLNSKDAVFDISNNVDLDFETKNAKLREQFAKDTIYYSKELESAQKRNLDQATIGAIKEKLQNAKNSYGNAVDTKMIEIEQENEKAKALAPIIKARLEAARAEEENQIKLLDSAYKTSAGTFKTEMVSATDFFVKYSKGQIETIGTDLFNQVQKSLVEMNKAKAELTALQTQAKTTTKTASANAFTTQANTPTASPTKPTTAQAGASLGKATATTGASVSLGKTASVNDMTKDPFATGRAQSGLSAIDDPFASKNTSYVPKPEGMSSDAKKTAMINALADNGIGHSRDWWFSNYIGSSIEQLKELVKMRGVADYIKGFDKFAGGGVAGKASIFGEAGPEAAFNFGQMKNMYEYVKNTTAMATNTNNYATSSMSNVYAPTIIVQGGGNEQTIRNTVMSTMKEFQTRSGNRK